MRYLLDTQILIFHLQGNPKLKAPLRTLIEDLAHVMLVSQFSLMEMSIKLKLGKLPEFFVSIENIIEQLLNDGFTLLPITNDHIFLYQTIPFFEEHRDPFDRFLIAAALSEKIPIISADEKFLLYPPLITVIH